MTPLIKGYLILKNVCLTNGIKSCCLITDLPNGWPALQTRLLNELIYTARRLGDPSLAVRYDPSCAGASYTVHENQTTVFSRLNVFKMFCSVCINTDCNILVPYVHVMPYVIPYV